MQFRGKEFFINYNNRSIIKRNFVIFICLITFLIPALCKGGWHGDDTEYHIDRLLSTLSMLRTGQYPQIFDFHNNFYYGNTWNLLYPPLSLVILLISYAVFSGDLNATVKCSAVIITVMTLLISFYAARSFRLRGDARWVAPCLYAFCPYLATNLYGRYDIAEAVGMCFIPLFFAGLVDLKNGGNALKLGYSMGLLFLSNIPICACAVFLICLYALFTKGRIRFFTDVACRAAPIAVGVSAFFLLPFLYAYLTSITHMTIRSHVFSELMSLSAISIENIIFLNNTKDGVQRGIGVPLSLLLILYLAQRMIRRKPIDPLVLCGSVLVCVIGGMVPFQDMPRLLSPLALPQFPWRYLAYLSFICAFSVLSNMQLRSSHLIGTLLFSLVCVMSIGGKVVHDRANLNAYAATRYQDYKQWMSDYVPEAAYEHMMRADDIRSEHCRLSNSGLNEHGFPYFHLSCTEPAWVKLPVLSYTAIRLTAPDIMQSRENGRFSVYAPKGETLVTFGFSRRFLLLFGVGLALSVTTVSWLALYGWRTRRNGLIALYSA